MLLQAQSTWKQQKGIVNQKVAAPDPIEEVATVAASLRGRRLRLPLLRLSSSSAAAAEEHKTAPCEGRWLHSGCRGFVPTGSTVCDGCAQGFRVPTACCRIATRVEAQSFAATHPEFHMTLCNLADMLQVLVIFTSAEEAKRADCDPARSPWLRAFRSPWPALLEVEFHWIAYCAADCRRLELKYFGRTTPGQDGCCAWKRRRLRATTPASTPCLPLPSAPSSSSIRSPLPLLSPLIEGQKAARMLAEMTAMLQCELDASSGPELLRLRAIAGKAQELAKLVARLFPLSSSSSSSSSFPSRTLPPERLA